MRQQPNQNGVRQRGKPKGVSSCEIAVWVGDNPPNNGDACAQKDRYTKSPAIIIFSADDAGKKLTFFARWIGAKGQPGPWCSAVEEIVPK